MNPRCAIAAGLLVAGCSSSDGPAEQPGPGTEAGVGDVMFEHSAEAEPEGAVPEAALPDAANDTSAGYSGSHTYTGPHGSRLYVVHVPGAIAAPAPLVVVLHGCYQNAEAMRALTRWDDLADDKSFVTVYPEQPASANAYQCWNWFEAAHQSRDSGEPAMIQGIVAEVMANVPIDPKRVFVTGLSAGGAMAVVMAATWPDLFASAGVVAGCPYKGTPCLQAPSSVDPATLAAYVNAAMGSHARVVPMIVMQGEADTAVPPANATLLVKQWLGAADLADDGQANGSVSQAAAKTDTGTAPGGEPYSVDTYEASGVSILEHWRIEQMAHAWPGGNASEAFADPNGPDATRELQRFLLGY